jgi:hypothetical protein
MFDFITFERRRIEIQSLPFGVLFCTYAKRGLFLEGLVRGHDCQVERDMGMAFTEGWAFCFDRI